MKLNILTSYLALRICAANHPIVALVNVLTPSPHLLVPREAHTPDNVTFICPSKYPGVLHVKLSSSLSMSSGSFMILCLFCQVVVVHDVKPFLNFESTDLRLTCMSQWC